MLNPEFCGKIKISLTLYQLIFLKQAVDRFVCQLIMLLKHMWNTYVSETMVLDDENLVYS